MFFLQHTPTLNKQKTEQVHQQLHQQLPPRAVNPPPLSWWCRQTVWWVFFLLINKGGGYVLQFYLIVLVHFLPLLNSNSGEMAGSDGTEMEWYVTNEAKMLQFVSTLTLPVVHITGFNAPFRKDLMFLCLFLTCIHLHEISSSHTCSVTSNMSHVKTGITPTTSSAGCNGSETKNKTAAQTSTISPTCSGPLADVPHLSHIKTPGY